MAEKKKQLDDQVREKIIVKYNASKTLKEISDELIINYNTVASVIKRFKKTDKIHSDKHRRPKVSVMNEIQKDFIRQAIDNDAATTLKKIKSDMLVECGTDFSLTTIFREVERFHYSLKKLTLIPVARNSESNIEKRYFYARDFFLFDENKIIFIDEMGISCSTRRLCGRSEIGSPAKKNVTAIRSKNFSICAAISKTKLLSFEISDKPYNADLYGEYLQNLFLTLASENISNGILIMDNCPMHKVDAIKEIINLANHRAVFLPPYSPQLNPIEEVFSKWKGFIKAQNSENVGQLTSAIFAGSFTLSTENILAYYNHMKTFLQKAIDRIEF